MATEQNSNSIELSESFSVTAETLFKAWTEADQLKKWWSPMGDSLENVTNELNEGGEVSYHFKSGDFHVTGKYKEVIPGEKLVYTWNWEFKDGLPQESYLLTIVFEENENGSILHVKQDEFQDEEVAKPHKDAWRRALDGLKSYLQGASETTQSSDQANLKSDEGMSDRSGGYNELPEQAKVGGG